MPYYLSFLISSRSYQNKILGQHTGGTRQAFNMIQIKSFDIPLPSSGLQMIFNEILAKLQKEVEKLELDLRKSEELFSSLVKGAF